MMPSQYDANTWFLFTHGTGSSPQECTSRIIEVMLDEDDFSGPGLQLGQTTELHGAHTINPQDKRITLPDGVILCVPNNAEAQWWIAQKDQSGGPRSGQIYTRDISKHEYGSVNAICPGNKHRLEDFYFVSAKDVHTIIHTYLAGPILESKVQTSDDTLRVEMPPSLYSYKNTALTVSPDGEWLAYTILTEKGQLSIHLIPLQDDGRLTKVEQTIVLHNSVTFGSAQFTHYNDSLHLVITHQDGLDIYREQ